MYNTLAQIYHYMICIKYSLFSLSMSSVSFIMSIKCYFSELAALNSSQKVVKSKWRTRWKVGWHSWLIRYVWAGTGTGTGTGTGERMGGTGERMGGTGERMAGTGEGMGGTGEGVGERSGDWYQGNLLF